MLCNTNQCYLILVLGIRTFFFDHSETNYDGKCTVFLTKNEMPIKNELKNRIFLEVVLIITNWISRPSHFIQSNITLLSKTSKSSLDFLGSS